MKKPVLKIEVRKKAYAVRVSLVYEKKEIGRAYLYVCTNDLHKEPFGLLEDVFVEEAFRGHDFGSLLVKKAVSEAKKHGCYKIIATSRKERPKLHRWYAGLGFKKYGFAFRMDL
jgi:GNAT superfamily N-acetyltransferase